MSSSTMKHYGTIYEYKKNDGSKSLLTLNYWYGLHKKIELSMVVHYGFHGVEVTRHTM